MIKISKSNVWDCYARSGLIGLIVASMMVATAQAQTTPSTISNPDILVYFKKMGSSYCPVDTAFRGDVTTSAGTGKAVLPTGVPVTAPTGTGDNKIFWVAIDKDTMQPLAKQTPAESFKFVVFFHPFQENDPFISQWRNGPKVYAIGPNKLRHQDRLPKGVDYKYTVATAKVVGGKLVVDPDCKPLDPNIRVL